MFYFVTFLDLQLQSCENSDFTNYEHVGDFEGFKGFVVKFMMKMSKVGSSYIDWYCLSIIYVYKGFFNIFFKRRSSNRKRRGNY